MKIVATFLDVVCTFNESFWLFQWVNILLKKRMFIEQNAVYKKYCEWIIEICFVTIVICMNNITLTSPYTMIVIMLFSLFVVTCLWKSDVMQSIAIVGGYFFCMFLKGNIEISITGMIGQDVLIQETTAEKGIIRVVYLVISGGIWFLINKYGTRYFRNKYIGRYESRYLAGISVVGFISCAFIGAIMLQSFNIHINLAWYIFLAFLLMAIAVFYYLLKQKDEKLRSTVLQAKNEMLEKNYMRVNEFYVSNAKLYHDMNHHFEAIYHMLQLGQGEQAKGYIESLRNQNEYNMGEIQTGINVLDAILYEMDIKANKKGIMLNMELSLLPCDVGISNSDICSLFANLLENAVEAAVKEVMLQIKFINRTIFVVVKNDYSIEPIRKEGKFLTNKCDKNIHGWGTQIVDQIVQKYEGDIQYDIKDGYFIVNLMINEKR